jgi:hypothetical protein
VCWWYCCYRFRRVLQEETSKLFSFVKLFLSCIKKVSRSQWPLGLTHELTSPIRTLGSWVRIPFKTWMSVYVHSVFVMSFVDSGLATGWSPVQGVLPTVLALWNWSETKLQGGSNKEKRERERETDRNVNRPYIYECETLCLTQTPRKHVVMTKYLLPVGVSWLFS